MANYTVEFLDFGGNVRAAHYIDHPNDAAAIEAAHRLNVLPHISGGFKVLQGDRLVHRHREGMPI
jgi:hypothetical protein